jgi:hypothetical protein
LNGHHEQLNYFNFRKGNAVGAGAIPLSIEKVLKDRLKKKSDIKIYLADTSYDGEGKIDVSFNGGNPVFTPPKHALLDCKLGKLSPAQFQKQYLKFLENSFIQHQYTWDKMLDSGKIVLVCSCNGADKNCHRQVLIKFLKLFGAVSKGKLTNA